MINEAIEDLDRCLSLDSQNTKALLRKADILHNRLQKTNEALIIYEEIQRMSRDEETIKFATDQLKKLEIVVGRSTRKNIEYEPEKVLVEGFKKEIKDQDYAKLILPKKITPSKSQQLVESFKDINKRQALKSIGNPKGTETNSKKNITLIEEL